MKIHSNFNQPDFRHFLSMRRSNRFEVEDNESNIDTLLAARRLAQCCPTSLSVDDFKSQSREKQAKIEYIPPSPKVEIEQTGQSAFKLGIPSAKHRFGFLLTDIKPIEQAKNQKSASTSSFKMKYELPNVRKVNTPVKSIKPLMVVSFSTTALSAADRGEVVLPANGESLLQRTSSS
ncbi:hypothetical protein TRFO_00942 [Tritrichomonas foetus]|uniref:Uncharacterized protein n=1 Tax=Tritrichomonas foetus TaxID=1144522 RepID=A0A1J4L3K2_9EUKA|nr:hypothetical protein TRFO_00942 [Tritrichomonas foetus]|eukprot:OHT17656.1 hypothetical protein TRFO_00942 [Tritrichomonas foetus]